MLQGPEGGRNGLMAAQGTNFKYVRADLEFGSSAFKEVGVRYKGNGTYWSSRDTLKRSLKADLNQFVKGQKLAGMSQINLHNSVRDRSGLNEALAYRLFRDGGVAAPRKAYARVYVSVPGEHEKQFFGLYNLAEDVGSAFLWQPVASAPISRDALGFVERPDRHRLRPAVSLSLRPKLSNS